LQGGLLLWSKIVGERRKSTTSAKFELGLRTLRTGKRAAKGGSTFVESGGERGGGCKRRWGKRLSIWGFPFKNAGQDRGKRTGPKAMWSSIEESTHFLKGKEQEKI